MNVHNLMEDIVQKEVDFLFDEAKKEKASWLTCDCLTCRLDTVSYVLNKIPPKYVVSGRGVSHSTEYLGSSQLLADVNALSIQGMRIVNSTKRPYHTNNKEDFTIQENSQPSFNFATFTGNIYDGDSFEPINEATLTLKCDGKIAQMVDKTWTNPFQIVKSLKGAYSFWVKPIIAEKEEITKNFNFSLEISAPEYTGITSYFEIPVTSEKSARSQLNSTFSFKLKDIFLFKADSNTDF